MSGPFRQTDAVLTIAQDNQRRAIEVTAANEIAGDVVGYPLEELKGKAFSDLVPPKIGEMIDDYVEFETGANDVGEVLRKVRDFQLKNSEGKALPFRLKIIRHHSMEHDEFLLIMQDETKKRETDSFLEMLRQNREGHEALVPETGLSDRVTYIKTLEFVSLHLDTFSQGVCMAVVELDAYDKVLAKYGVKACHKLVQNVAALCQQNLRDNDVVAQLGKRRLGLILLGAGQEPGKIVLNRLRWLISSLNTHTEQGVNIQTTVTIVFRELQGGAKVEERLQACEKHLDDKPASSINLVAKQ